MGLFNRVKEKVQRPEVIGKLTLFQQQALQYLRESKRILEAPKANPEKPMEGIVVWADKFGKNLKDFRDKKRIYEALGGEYFEVYSSLEQTMVRITVFVNKYIYTKGRD